MDLVAIDEHSGYRYLKWVMPRDVVAHSARQYVRERGIIGSYHNVSKKYLLRYLAEFRFRFNNRNNPDIFETAIAGS